MSIRVFLADDHNLLREGVRRLLEEAPGVLVVGEAEDGVSAVEAISRLKPDIAVLDITMPGLSGIEAALRIRDLCPACRVIILSMHSGSDQVYEALRAGAQGYLLKEVAAHEVLDAIRSVHAGRRYLSEKITGTVIDDYLAMMKENPDRNWLERLSRREREVLRQVVQGQSSAEIAKNLSLSPKTVETYRSRVMKKLEVDNLAELVRLALRHGLLEPE